MNTRAKFLFGFIFLLFISCSDDQPDKRTDFIPYVVVNEQLNLSNIQYVPLRQDRGYVYHPSGVRGIIVFRQNAARYSAFERNCPYQPSDSCAVVEMDASGLFMTDPCCGSKFDLEGQPIAGPNRYPLLQYQVSLSGNTLYISN